MSNIATLRRLEKRLRWAKREGLHVRALRRSYRLCWGILGRIA